MKDKKHSNIQYFLPESDILEIKSLRTVIDSLTIGSDSPALISDMKCRLETKYEKVCTTTNSSS